MTKNTDLLLEQANTTHVDDWILDIELRAQIAVWCNMILLEHLKTNKIIKMIFIFDSADVNLLFVVLPRNGWYHFDTVIYLIGLDLSSQYHYRIVSFTDTIVMFVGK